MMNDIFRTLIAEGIIVVYLDNILIFTKTEEEHERAVQQVLEILAEHKLFLCPEKCEFHQKQIEYLRLVISENKVKMDPVKVARVCDWPTPEYHKWLLTICDGCFDTLKSSKMRS